MRSLLRDSQSETVRRLYSAVRSIYWHFRPSPHREASEQFEKMHFDEVERVVSWSMMYLRKDDVKGDVAEFGVWTGTYSPIECRWLSFFRQKRNLHLFDSWKGYGEPAPQDLTSSEYERGAWRPPSTVLETQKRPEVLKRELAEIYRGGEIITHEGWFSDTLPKLPASTKFALIIVDAGLFSAIHEVLEYLFANSHISDGAILLFNSYNASRASPQRAGGLGRCRRKVQNRIF